MDNGHFKNDDVESLSFFHPDLTSDGAYEIMIKNAKKHGIYLLRRSCKSPGSYSISVMHYFKINKRHEGNVVNFRINRKNDKFFLGVDSFNDIPSMVCHFTNLPIVNKEGDLVVYLTQPICRWHGLSSWKDSTLECCSPHAPLGVYITFSTRPSSKPSMPELDLKELQKFTDHFRDNDPYVNQNFCNKDARTNRSNQNDLNVPLKDNWVLESLRASTSPNGKIPREIWVSLSKDVQRDMLSYMFDYLDIN